MRARRHCGRAGPGAAVKVCDGFQLHPKKKKALQRCQSVVYANPVHRRATTAAVVSRARLVSRKALGLGPDERGRQHVLVSIIGHGVLPNYSIPRLLTTQDIHCQYRARHTVAHGVPAAFFSGP